MGPCPAGAEAVSVPASWVSWHMPEMRLATGTISGSEKACAACAFVKLATSAGIWWEAGPLTRLHVCMYLDALATLRLSTSRGPGGKAYLVYESPQGLKAQKYLIAEGARLPQFQERPAGQTRVALRHEAAKHPAAALADPRTRMRSSRRHQVRRQR